MASRIVFILKAESPSDSTAEAEQFCQNLKKILLEEAPRNGIMAKVEFAISPDVPSESHLFRGC